MQPDFLRFPFVSSQSVQLFYSRFVQLFCSWFSQYACLLCFCCKDSPDNLSHSIFFLLWNYTITFDVNVQNVFQNVQCSVPDTLHVFPIPYANYLYNFACLGLWNVFTLSNNWISPLSLLSDWWSSHVLRTRVHMLNIIFFFTFIHVNITITWFSLF